MKFAYMISLALVVLLFGCIGPPPETSPTPSATATETPVVTETPTPIETPTETPVVTETPTESPTPETSATPGVTATPTPGLGGSPSELDRDNCEYLPEVGGFGTDAPGRDHPNSEPGTGTGYEDNPCAPPLQ